MGLKMSLRQRGQSTERFVVVSYTKGPRGRGDVTVGTEHKYIGTGLGWGDLGADVETENVS